jgi:hypothetical protein
VSAALASSTAADGHRAITVAALMATYMEAVNISIPNAALPHIQGTLSMADDEVGWAFTSYAAQDRNFVLSTIMVFATGFVLLPTLALTAPMLEDLLNYPVDTAGYMLMPRGVTLVGALVLMSFAFCRKQGIVLQAFAALGHAMKPSVVDDPVIAAIAQRVHKTPAQIALAWAVQRGTAFLTTSTKPQRNRENFEVSALPEDAMREIRERITENVRFNAVVEMGVPGFIPRAG